MTATSRNLYIDKTDDIVNKYNNTYYTSIKMKPIDVTDNTYIDLKKEINDKDPKFKVGDYVRISKYKNIFAKGYMPIGQKKFLLLVKLKILCHGHMLLMILTEKKLSVLFMKKNYNMQARMNLE